MIDFSDGSQECAYHLNVAIHKVAEDAIEDGVERIIGSWMVLPVVVILE